LFGWLGLGWLGFLVWFGVVWVFSFFVFGGGLFWGFFCFLFYCRFNLEMRNQTPKIADPYVLCTADYDLRNKDDSDKVSSNVCFSRMRYILLTRVREALKKVCNI